MKVSDFLSRAREMEARAWDADVAAGRARLKDRKGVVRNLAYLLHSGARREGRA